MRPVILAMTLSVLFAGCAQSLHELRQAAPDHVRTLAGDYTKIATCAAAGMAVHPWLSGRGEYRLLHHEPERAAAIAMIVGALVGLTSNQAAMVEWRLADEGNGTVRVESRRFRPHLNPGGTRTEEAAGHEVIDRCANRLALGHP